MDLTEAVRDPAHGGDAPGRIVEVLGRVGLLAYGGVHVALAGLVIAVLVGAGGPPADQSGAVAVVGSLGWGGRLLLAAATVALAAFGVWQVCAAATGFRWVSGGERVRKRVGAAAKAIAVFSVAAVTATMALGGQLGSANQSARTATAVLLDVPGGRVLVGAIAAVLVVVAASMLYTAARATFMGDLWRGRLSRAMTVVAVTCGSTGNLARAVALGGVGWSFAEAAVTADPARSTGIDGVVRALADRPLGSLVLVLVAAGLAAFGAYCVIDATARRA